MELFDVMRTTFSGRTYTSDPLPDATIFRILDHDDLEAGGTELRADREGFARR